MQGTQNVSFVYYDIFIRWVSDSYENIGCFAFTQVFARFVNIQNITNIRF